MRIRTWQAILTGLAVGVFCSLVWNAVFHISCPSVFHLLPWLCWPIVAAVTAAVTVGFILYRRFRARRSDAAPRLLPRSGIRA